MARKFLKGPQSGQSQERLARTLIDPDWYRSTYRDVNEAGANPADHFLKTGWMEGRSPHPLFDTAWYLSLYPDVEDAGLNPLLHFIQTGWKEGRQPHALFDTGFYLETYPDAASTPNPLQFFLETGWKRGDNPGPVFDTNWYLESYPDVRELNINPILHYLQVGFREDRSPHPLFDTRYYHTQYPDVQRAGKNPLEHFLTTGWKERRQPNPDFSPDWYLLTNPDVAEAGLNPLVHYLRSGWTEERSAAPGFDDRAYFQKFPDARSAGIPALVHYYLSGKRAFQREPGAPPNQANTETPSIKKVASQMTRKCFSDPTAGLTNEQAAERIRQNAQHLSSRPLVTILIPVYQNLSYTLRCVASILESKDRTPYRILIADDASPDSSGTWLAETFAGIAGIEVKVNPDNLGFLRSCNAAAESIDTEFIYLLNNDTFVIDGWLDELVNVFRRHSDCGLAGAKLLYPDGTLQEAGGIIWNDASGANFGRGQDPWRPEFNYQRDADYISGAANMIPTSVWRELVGFSDYFAPAYYEDTDFAMKVRKSGRRVIYQPLASVIHFEGISSGTDITQGVKRHQEINRHRFSKKWHQALQRHGEPADFSRGTVDRRVALRVLIFDAETPRPDKDSGSVTAFQYMRILTELGVRVTFVPENLLWCNKHSRALQRLGVEVIFAPYETNARDYVLRTAGDYDAIIVSRAPVGGRLVNELKEKYPGLPVIFDTVDIHHLRMFRQYELENEWALWEAAAEMKTIEMEAIRQADMTILVSDAEVTYLADEIGPFPHTIIPLIYEDHNGQRSFEQRRDVAFVGGFRHQPNVDAVRYLVNEIWPLFRAHDTGAKLHIIGSHMPASFNDFASEDIIIAGYIEDLEGYLENIRLTVAPLRYGAGVKGKVGNSLRQGIPVVGTPIAFEGMGLIDRVHVRTGKTPAELAEALGALYASSEEWSSMSVAGRKFVADHFSVPAARMRFRTLLANLGLKTFG